MLQNPRLSGLRIIGLGLVLVFVLFSRGCLGRVPAPTDLLYQWYPWETVKRAGYDGPRNPLLYDAAAQVYPWISFAREEIQKGRLPLWNPYAGCGIPHAANPVTTVFSPFNVFNWILPLPFALLILHAAKVFLGWTFMALYLRHRGLGAYETLLGAAAFSLSGFVIVWLFWPLSSTFIWLPILFLCSERVMDGGSRRDVAILGVVAGLSILSGHVETTFHHGTVLIGYCIGRLAWKAYRRQRSPAEAGLALLRLALAALLAAALTAILLLPFFEYLGLSHALAERAALTENPYFARPSRALALLVPNFYGSPALGQFWSSAGTYIEAAQGYFGVIPFALFLIGTGLAVRRRDPSGIGFAAIAIGSLAVVFGVPPIHGLVTALPGFAVALNHRLLGVTAFAGIVLGAGALQTIMARRPEDRRDIIYSSVFAGACIVLILVVLPFAAARRPGDIMPGAFSSPVATIGPPLWVAAHLLLAVGLTGGLGLLISLLLSGGVGLRGFRRFVAALVLLDLAWFALPFNPMTPPDEIYPPTEATRFLAEPGRPPFRVAGTTTHFPVGTNIPYRIQDIRAYDAMGIARYEEVRRLVEDPTTSLGGEPILDRGVLDFLNVRYLVRSLPPDQVGDWPLLHDHSTGEILPGAPIGQTFVAPSAGLYGVAFLLGTFQRTNRGTLGFHLLEEGPGGREVATAAADMAALEDNRWHIFEFPPVEDSAGKRYYAYLDSRNTSLGGSVTVWASWRDPYPQGKIFRSHRPGGRESLCFQAFTQSAARPITKIPGLSIYENRNYLPRAYLVRRVSVARSGEESLGWIREGRVDLRQRVILEEPVRVLPKPDGVEEGRVQITSYQPDEVQIEIESNPALAVLVMSDTHYPGWEAWLDDVEVPLLRANHAFRAVVVGQGSHTLVLRFRPSSTRWGAAISLLALLGIAYLLVKGDQAGLKKSS